MPNTHELLSLTADIVSAHVSNNSVAINDVSGLISAVHDALEGLGRAPEVSTEEQKPAISIRASVKPDYIVCLEDGKRLKMLKRYLRTNFNMSPEEYRTKWGLPRDYPMVAPNYAKERRNLAFEIGLGKGSRMHLNVPSAKDRAAISTKAETKAAAKPRGRPRKTAG